MDIYNKVTTTSEELLKLLQIIRFNKRISRANYLKIAKIQQLESKMPKSTFSYVLDIDGLLKSKGTANEIYMYLFLAGKRDYSLFKLHKVTTLPVYIVEEYINNLQQLKSNRLLSFDNTENNVYFKY